jgi:S1-C subfamily serine protease
MEPSQSDVLQRILPSAVQVVVEQQEGRRVRTGSGVVIASHQSAIGPECLVLTSGHTIEGLEGQREIHVVLGQHRGEAVRARATVAVVRVTNDLDMALLRIRSSSCTPAPPAEPPILGEPVWVVGFPMGQAMTLASGIVSQIRLPGSAGPGAGSRLKVDAPVSYGSSGGGVYAMRGGGLLGIVEGYSTARLSSQGVTPAWFIDVPVPGHTLVTPLPDIQKFLESTGQGDLLAGR